MRTLGFTNGMDLQRDDMIFPDKFKIGRTPYVVQYKAKLACGSYGRVWPLAGVMHIELRKPKDMNVTFWHEATHAILHDMNSPLWKDEKFVTAFSTRLAKMVDSAKFKES